VGLLLALALAALPPGAGVVAAPVAPPPVAPPPAELPPEEQAILAELFTLGRKRDEARAAILQVSQEIAQTAQRQADAAAERGRLEARRKERQAQLARRLRAYQVNGRGAPFAVLFGATSFVDFLARLDLVGQILDRDAKLLADLRSLKEGVAAQEAELRSASEQLSTLRTTLAREEAGLLLEIATREGILASLQEKRAEMEARLASLETAWEKQGQPVLLALGTTLSTVDPATFEPDNISFSLFPPGATAVISAENLTRFFAQVKELQGLTVQLVPGGVLVAGQFDGAPIRIGGRFTIAGQTTLRYEPEEIQVREFVVPPESIAAWLEDAHIDIDLSGMVNPWVLKSVDVNGDEIRLKAGMK
jgi:hypothetical protein